MPIGQSQQPQKSTKNVSLNLKKERFSLEVTGATGTELCDVMLLKRSYQNVQHQISTNL